MPARFLPVAKSGLARRLFVSVVCNPRQRALMNYLEKIDMDIDFFISGQLLAVSFYTTIILLFLSKKMNRKANAILGFFTLMIFFQSIDTKLTDSIPINTLYLDIFFNTTFSLIIPSFYLATSICKSHIKTYW